MISVIVPVYGVEKYLNKCLDSILAQTYKDIEVILIDDGSPDNCGKICDDYALKDKRVKVIHKENQGLLAAWKTGLLASSGELVGFVDSDDYIEPDYYYCLYDALVSNDADMAVCSFVRENVENIERIRANVDYGVYEGAKLEEYKNNFFNIKDFNEVVRWNKLFKRDKLMANFAFYDERITNGEDFGVSLSYTLDCDKIVFIEYFGYHYTVRQNSVMNNFNPQWIENIGYLMDNIEAVLKAKNRTAAFDINVETLMHVGNTVYKILASNADAAEKKRLLKRLRNDGAVKNVKYLGNMKYADKKMKLVLLAFKCRFYFLLTGVAAKLIRR